LQPTTVAKSPRQPWSSVFKDKRLGPAWKQLFIGHPARFAPAFGKLWPECWRRYYLRQAGPWRTAPAERPLPVAHAVSHDNAERLWRLAAAP